MLTVELGDRIAAEVLPAYLIKGAGGIELIRECPCQYGACGHCSQGGRHDMCTTRVAFQGRPPTAPETRIVGRDGRAGWPVLSAGRSCVWRCSCVCPAPEPLGTVQLGLFDVAGVARG